MLHDRTVVGALTDDEIEELLRTSVIGRLGVHVGARNYVVPMTYGYDGTSVVCHSVDGMKLHMLRSSPHGVCFEVDQIDDLANWRSVIAWGEFEELGGERAARALQLLTDQMSAVAVPPAVHPGAATPVPAGLSLEASAEESGARAPTVFRIRLHERTGRFERVSHDEPAIAESGRERGATLAGSRSGVRRASAASPRHDASRPSLS